MRFVLASHNKGKLAELQEILGELGVEVVLQSDVGLDLEPEETGTTFAENAKIKAQAVMEASGLPAIGDDSGLCVDWLQGAPGIYSARYAEPGHRKERVLRELQNVPDSERGGAFYCAIACVIPGDCTFTVSGECRGMIAHEPVGTGGFGYDPIFYLPEYGCTTAELSAEDKNAVSHRGKALRAIREVIEAKLG